MVQPRVPGRTRIRFVTEHEQPDAWEALERYEREEELYEALAFLDYENATVEATVELLEEFDHENFERDVEEAAEEATAQSRLYELLCKEYELANQPVSEYVPFPGPSCAKSRNDSNRSDCSNSNSGACNADKDNCGQGPRVQTR
mmetsp:Transcript_36184/g.82469  ORF Transcript_36184/g.82469 Transcript_36184/m.82469 type:complete len:145 (-) Transcript_36184:202-636(-)